MAKCLKNNQRVLQKGNRVQKLLGKKGESGQRGFKKAEVNVVGAS